MTPFLVEAIVNAQILGPRRGGATLRRAAQERSLDGRLRGGDRRDLCLLVGVAR
jgi:hypothetical protein